MIEDLELLWAPTSPSSRARRPTRRAGGRTRRPGGGERRSAGRRRLHDAAVGCAHALAPSRHAEREAHAARARRRAHLGIAARARAPRGRAYGAAFERDDLPPALAERWLASDGRELVEITPAEDVSDNAAARRFITAVHGVVPTATGLPVVYQERRQPSCGVRASVAVCVPDGGGDHLVRAARLEGYAARARADRARVDSHRGLTVLVGMPFNYANIIALPLLVGIGVDNGIHVVHRMRTERASGCSTRARCGPCSRAGSRRSRASAIWRSRRTWARRAWASCSRSGSPRAWRATLIVLPAWLKLRASRRSGAA